MSQLVVAVVGYTGGVGTCLLNAMKKINLKPYALVRSKTMTVGEDGMEIPVDFGALASRLLDASKDQNAVPVIADVTASGKVQEHYKDWLNQGISVVAANKGKKRNHKKRGKNYSELKCRYRMPQTHISRLHAKVSLLVRKKIIRDYWKLPKPETHVCCMKPQLVPAYLHWVPLKDW